MTGNLFKKLVFGVIVLSLGLALNTATVFCSPEEGSKAPAPAAKAPEPKAEEGYIELLTKDDQGKYSKHGWNHYGPGCFDLDENTGVLTSHGGMGLFWYSAKKFRNFVLELDFLCDKASTNSGVFLRVPEMPISDDYIYASFEIQIYDDTSTTTEKVYHDPKERVEFQLKHTTGAVYDANPPTKFATLGPGKWNHYKLTCDGMRIVVELNGQVVNDWMEHPAGKVATCWPEGYIGLQNHDNTSSVHFKNIRVKELK